MITALGLEIDSTGALVAIDRLGGLTAAGARAEAQSQRLTRETDNLTNLYRRQAAAILTVEQALERETARARAAIGMNDRLAESLAKMRAAAAQSQANAMASMIKAEDPFQKQAESAAKASLNFAKLREGMTGLAVAASGMNGPLGSVISNLGMMAAGAPVMVGVLAGVAALGLVWDMLTAKTRAAREESKKTTEYLNSLAREQKFGAFGDPTAAFVSAGRDLARIRAEIAEKTALAEVGGPRAGALARELRELGKQETEKKRLVQAAQTEILRIEHERRDEQVRLAKEATDKELAEVERLKKAQREYGDLLAGNTLLPGVGAARVAPVRSVVQIPQSVIASVQIAQLVSESIRDVTEKQRALAQSLNSQFADAFRDILESGLAGIDRMFQRIRSYILQTFAEMATRKLSTSLAGFIGTAATTTTPGTGANGDAVAGIGAAIQAHPFAAAAVGLGLVVGGLLSMRQRSREAAEQLRQLNRAFQDNVTAAKVAVGEASALELQIAQAAKEFEVMREQARQLSEAEKHKGTVYVDSKASADALAAQLKEIDRLESERIKQLKQYNAVETELQAQELRTRALRAAGYTAEAEELAFVTAQQRELNEARGRGAEADEIAALETIHLAEAQARQAELARKQKEALEDLNVRMLEALGYNEDSIAALRLAQAQQREYEQAVRDGASATVLAALAETQKAEATAAAITRVKATIEGLSATIDGLQSFKDQLLLSETVSPTDRLAEAERQYNAALALAKTGDAGAAGRLPASAQTFLAALREVNGSGAAFQAGRDRVLADTDAVMAVFKDQRSIAQQQLDELIRIRALQQQALDLQLFDDTPRRRFPLAPEDSANIAAAVTVSQAGFTLLSTKLDSIASKLDEQTDVTRQGFEGTTITTTRLTP